MSLLPELQKSGFTIQQIGKAIDAGKPAPYLAGRGIQLTRLNGVGTSIGVQPDLLVGQQFRVLKNTGALTGQTGKFTAKSLRINPDEASAAAVGEGDAGIFASNNDAEIWDAFRLKSPIYLSMLAGTRTVAAMSGGTVTAPKQTPIYLAFIGVPFLVRLTQNGGSAGTSSTQCSFTYDVYAWSDSGKVDKLNTASSGAAIALTGNGIRADKGEYTAATYGIAFYDTDGTIKLIAAFEAMVTAPGCVPA